MIIKADEAGIERAAVALGQGDLVGLPTETVYGLAADGFNEEAIAQVFAAKGRPHFDPLIYHLADETALRSLASEVSEPGEKLIRAFWPGALTFVLPKNKDVPDLATSGLPSVAVRCPQHPVARALLEAFGGPVVAPSANRFGRISPTDAQSVEQELGEQISIILDGGDCRLGIESTIIDLQGEGARILRLGAVTREAIEEVIGPVTLVNQNETDGKVNAPGMLKSHYAPRTPLQLIDQGSWLDLDLSEAALLLFEKGEGEPRCPYRILSESGNDLEAAANLFRSLRSLDSLNVSTIYAERPPHSGLGLAILDRLTRASS
ncbi:MAG: L-threonylcarbamoyladenylate synthase [Verrucomicrobiota bacterium]